MRSKTASTCASSVWSQRKAMPVPPRAVTSSAVSSIVPGRPSVVGCPRTLRPVTYTVAPCSPSTHAMPFPPPRLAPVTSATFPSKVASLINDDDRTLPTAATRSGSQARVGIGSPRAFALRASARLGVERAPLQPAGLVDREQPFDRAFATLRAAAERELAVDDGGAQAAFGGVVGRLDIGH